MSSKKLTGRQLRDFRGSVAKLKSLGLVGKRVDARAQKPTRYMRETVKKFDDVLKGRAKVVTVPKRADAKEFANAFRVKGRKVVVGVEPGETLRYAPSRKTIIGHVDIAGRKVKRLHLKERLEDVTGLPFGPRIRYAIPIGNTIQRFDTYEDLAAFMYPYEHAARNPYVKWREHVIVEEIEPDDDAEQFEEVG